MNRLRAFFSKQKYEVVESIKFKTNVCILSFDSFICIGVPMYNNGHRNLSLKYNVINSLVFYEPNLINNLISLLKDKYKTNVQITEHNQMDEFITPDHINDLYITKLFGVSPRIHDTESSNVINNFKITYKSPTFVSSNIVYRYDHYKRNN